MVPTQAKDFEYKSEPKTAEEITQEIFRKSRCEPSLNPCPVKQDPIQAVCDHVNTRCQETILQPRSKHITRQRNDTLKSICSDPGETFMTTIFITTLPMLPHHTQLRHLIAPSPLHLAPIRLATKIRASTYNKPPSAIHPSSKQNPTNQKKKRKTHHRSYSHYSTAPPHTSYSQ